MRASLSIAFGTTRNHLIASIAPSIIATQCLRVWNEEDGRATTQSTFKIERHNSFGQRRRSHRPWWFLYRLVLYYNDIFYLEPCRDLWSCIIAWKLCTRYSCSLPHSLYIFCIYMFQSPTQQEVLSALKKRLEQTSVPLFPRHRLRMLSKIADGAFGSVWITIFC